MASTAVFNGALCASHVINGALSAGQAFKWGFVEKNESSHSCVFFLWEFNGSFCAGHALLFNG